MVDSVMETSRAPYVGHVPPVGHVPTVGHVTTRSYGRTEVLHVNRAGYGSMLCARTSARERTTT